MNRRNRTLVVLLVAVGIASAATFVVYRAISNIPERYVPVAQKFYVVATGDLSMGSRLTKENIKLQGWPEEIPVEGVFEAPEAIIGRSLIQAVSSNELLTERKLAPEGTGGLTPAIPAGMLAVAVRVNDVIGVAGYTVPGTRVDVLVTVRSGDTSRSKVFISNAQVLTAGTVIDQEQARDGKPIPSTVVTLLLTPEDAEKVTLAQNSGAITLALRNPLWSEPTQTAGTSLPQLLGPANPAPVVSPDRRRPVASKPVAAPPPAPPSTYRIETIKAGKVTTDEVVK